MTKIVITGDSNTTNTYVTTTYAQLLGSVLGATVYNTAMSGYYTLGVLGNINSMILDYSPDVCILMVGTNDIANASETAADNRTMTTASMASMKEIITKVKSAGINLIILSPPMSRNLTDWQRGVEFSDALKWLCIENNVEFLDVYSMFLSLSKTSTLETFNSYFRPDPDKYHLLDSGHALIANYLLNNSLLKVAAPAATSTNTTSSTGVVFSQTCPDVFGNIMANTAKIVIPKSAITLPNGTVTRWRFTLQAAVDESITVSELYLGIQTSAASSATLVPIKYNGNINYTIAPNSQLTTDWTPLSWDKTSNLILSLYCAGGANSDKLMSNISNSLAVTYLRSGNYANATSGSGFTGYNKYLSLVNKIETDGF